MPRGTAAVLQVKMVRVTYPTSDHSTSPASKRRAKPKTLAYASVPASACQLLDQFFDTKKGLGRQTGMFKLAFWTLAHLLAHGGEWYIPTEAFVKFGGAKDNSCRARQVDRLIDPGLIEVTHEPAWSQDGESGTATWYRITDPVLELMLASDDGRAYSTPHDYATRRPFKAMPCGELDGSFDERLAHEPHTGAIMLNLQAQPLRFDKMGLIHWLRQNRAALAASEVRKQLGFAMALQDGPNYARYRLARSGRLLSVESNLQGIPKTTRRWFRPAEGHTFWTFDFASQEPRIFAYLSGDKKLQAAVEDDIYLMVADRYGLDRNSQVKPMFAAWLYGARTIGVARAAFGLPKNGTPTPEQLGVAQAFVDFMRDEFSVAAAWVKAKVKEIRKAQRAVTVGGFVRVSETGCPLNASTAGLNHLVQGAGADILRAILRKLEVRLAGTGARIVLPLHDGLLAEIPGVEADAEVSIIKDSMEETVGDYLPGLTIPVTIERGWPGKHTDREPPALPATSGKPANRAA